MKYVGAAGLDMGSAKISNLGAATAATDATRNDQVGGVYEYVVDTWVLTTNKVYIRRTGDPAPPAAGDDITLTQS